MMLGPVLVEQIGQLIKLLQACYKQNQLLILPHVRETKHQDLGKISMIQM